MSSKDVSSVVLLFGRLGVTDIEDRLLSLVSSYVDSMTIKGTIKHINITNSNNDPNRADRYVNGIFAFKSKLAKITYYPGWPNDEETVSLY